MKGYVSAIITEDSDIIAFGARVVFFKMDKEGNGWEPLTTHLTTHLTAHLTTHLTTPKLTRN